MVFSYMISVEIYQIPGNFSQYMQAHYFHFNALSILYPRSIYALSIHHNLDKKGCFRNGWISVFDYYLKDKVIC